MLLNCTHAAAPFYLAADAYSILPTNQQGSMPIQISHHSIFLPACRGCCVQWASYFNQAADVIASAMHEFKQMSLDGDLLQLLLQRGLAMAMEFRLVRDVRAFTVHDTELPKHTPRMSPENAWSSQEHNLRNAVPRG